MQHIFDTVKVHNWLLVNAAPLFKQNYNDGLTTIALEEEKKEEKFVKRYISRAQIPIHIT